MEKIKTLIDGIFQNNACQFISPTAVSYMPNIDSKYGCHNSFPLTLQNTGQIQNTENEDTMLTQ